MAITFCTARGGGGVTGGVIPATIEGYLARLLGGMWSCDGSSWLFAMGPLGSSMQ